MLYLAFFSLFIASSLAAKGVDVSRLHSVSTFKCMLNEGYSFAIVRCYRSSGSIDPNCAPTIEHAWSGGMKHVDMYAFPCPTCGKTAAAQANELIHYIKNQGVRFGQIWLDVEEDSQHQYWKECPFNINFITEWVTTIMSAFGEGKVGIYANKRTWTGITCNAHTLGNLPVWYAHYDDNPSFSDFSQFGQWTKPAIKQYKGTSKLCDGSVDLNWYP